MKTELGFLVVADTDWSHVRHSALQKALDTPASYVHYADMDRLIRWVETRPQEWRRTIEAVQEADCLIIGRTKEAQQTHPQAIQRTEKIINTVFSERFGQPVDLCAGSKGFSRRAVEFLMAHSPPGRALGTDAEWPILLQRAGFTVECLAVDGLDWETPDRYRPRAADPETQRRAAEAYDQDAQHWAYRVQVALDIVQAGLAASQQPLSE